jgi:hypothetical protein
VKSRLQVKFPDHYHDDPYEWQDFHECAHFLLARTAAESSVGTITQARVPAVFAIPPTYRRQPRDLQRYFKELELLFGPAQVVNNMEKKKHTCQYVNIDTADLWEAILL